jgi:hypothetical protein
MYGGDSFLRMQTEPDHVNAIFIFSRILYDILPIFT